RLSHFDRQTGQRKEDIKLPQPVLHLRHDADSLVAISAPDETRRVLTRVSFANGDVQTEEVKLESPPPAKNEPADAPPTDEMRDELLVAGPTVVQMKVKL